MIEQIQERINQLIGERRGLTEDLQQIDAERVRVQHLISAYDGAIGELQRLAQMDGAFEPPLSAV